MTMNKLLGISLALVMLTGSVPLGFAEPLRVQLEQEIETKNLQCDNPNHVLVERDNGKLACVSERTAERTGWEILSQIRNTVSSENSIPYYGGMINGEPSEGIVRAELSNLPKLNEVVTLTVTTINIFDESVMGASSEPSEQLVQFNLRDGWEFVNVSQNQISSEPLDEGTQLTVTELLTVSINESQTFTVQLKPTQLGYNYFSVGIPFVESVQFGLFVGENETLPAEQYWQEHPEESPWNNEPTSSDVEPIPELTLEELIEKIENSEIDWFSKQPRLYYLNIQLEVRNYIENNGWPSYSEEQVITQATEYIQSIDYLFSESEEYGKMCGLVLNENFTVGKIIIDDKPYHNISMGSCNDHDEYGLVGTRVVEVIINAENSTDIDYMVYDFGDG